MRFHLCGGFASNIHLPCFPKRWQQVVVETSFHYLAKPQASVQQAIKPDINIEGTTNNWTMEGIVTILCGDKNFSWMLKTAGNYS
jgi:hypothetical protein